MNIEKLSVSKNREHCNFCDRGVMNMDSHGYTLQYPYETVYSIEKSSGNGVKVNICEECLSELKPIVNSIKK